MHSGSDEIPSVDLMLPDELRGELGRQYADLVDAEQVKSISLRYPVVSVGDVVTATLFSSGLIPKISVFDLMSERGNLSDEMQSALLSMPGPVTEIKNPAGVLTAQLCRTLVHLYRLQGCRKIRVIGEEDLAGLASIAYLEGGAVVYGIPGKGMSCIISDRTNSSMAKSIISRMKPVQ